MENCEIENRKKRMQQKENRATETIRPSRNS